MTRIDASTISDASTAGLPADCAILLFVKGDGPGGVERIALRLAEGLHNAGISTHILSATPIPSRPAVTCAAPAWPLIGMRWPLVRLFWALVQHVRRHPGLILFCPGNSYTGVAVALKLLLGRRCPPIVAKISNDLVRHDMPLVLRAFYRAWLWLQGQLIDHVAVLSAPMAQEVSWMMRLPAHRIHIVPNPVLGTVDLDETPRLHRPGHAGRRFVAVGRLERQKDYPAMLRAFAIGARADDCLTIYGDGKERATLEALAHALGIAAQVRFAGHCPDVRSRLADHDILLLSSRYEGLPGAVVEALAAGIGIIATQCCVSMADLLDDGALGALVEPGDIDALAHAIAQAVPGQQDRARARIKASASTIEAAVPAYAALFATVRQGRPSRHANPHGPFPTQLARSV